MRFEEDHTFGNRADQLIVDGQPSARISRALDNSQRNVAKWIKGDEGAPPHAKEFVESQLAIVAKQPAHPFIVLQAEAQKWMDAGIHPEVVAGYLSKLYTDITGKSIR